ncbi:LysR family transcriptional regulator [Mergibacter septicus]|uniref:LysR family transcriptional regulator n=1 Tax=Mergibacter septicus TaxID=221402 RepID=A0A8D4IVR9_9PAST|nr:LysR family transcriptional regulator [Mergibacter septicus]AWX14788.1 LysR family transcriptional regulator [Mergibacter septicus]QDJ14039.1 LysR family transcriptional regulator [Mergibacter septicus]UTU48513.1 LysR family transcriptional regulator [Mergibacter septicus]WMR95857.1 LysR family transcriptional regulator [Mergibacter septicus]
MYLWEGINEFVAVVEKESFTLAAKQLGISVAQVSRQINMLENRLNTKLFYRTTRRVSLTAEGSIYYRHCRQLVDGLEEAERAISNLRDIPQGLIKMTAPVTYGEKYIVPLVNDFMQQYSEVKVIVNLTNLQLDLVEGGYDLAIRLGRLENSSMIAKRLRNRTMYLCAAPKYLDRFGTPSSLEELSNHNCLVGNNPYWRFQVQGKERMIKLSGSFVCNSGYGLRDAVLKGLGIAQLPEYYVDQDLMNGKLVSLLEQYQEPEEGIWALYPHNRHLSPKIRLLVDLFAKELPQKYLSSN